MSAGGNTVLLLTFARRGEEPAVRDALRFLRDAIPVERVEAVGTLVSEPVLRELGADDVICYGDKSGAVRLLREARSRRYAAALVLYCGPGLYGHLKLEALALLAGAKRLYRVESGEAPRVTGRLRLAWSVGIKALQGLVRATGATAMCGVAFVCLRMWQLLAGGHRASRT